MYVGDQYVAPRALLNALIVVLPRNANVPKFQKFNQNTYVGRTYSGVLPYAPTGFDKSICHAKLLIMDGQPNCFPVRSGAFYSVFLVGGNINVVARPHYNGIVIPFK